MYFQLQRVTAPEIECITLAEARRHLRLFEDIQDEDDDIEGLIVAAREWIEDFTAHALIDQKWKLTLHNSASVSGGSGNTVSGTSPTTATSSGSYAYAGGGLALRRTPVLSVVSVTGIGSDGTETVLEADTYVLRGAQSKFPELVMLNGGVLPTGAVEIIFRAGYADRLGSPQQGAEMVPRRFIQAMKLWLEANYDRDAVMMPLLLEAAEKLIRSERAVVPFA